MLSLEKFQPYFYNVEASVYTNNKSKPKKEPLYDTLFSVIYHTLHENNPYYKYNEQLEKIKLLEKLEPLTIKHKSKLVNDLNNERISLLTVSFISYVYKQNIIWYTPKCYTKFIQNDKEGIYIMLDKVTDKVGLDGLYEITNIDKPIKSVSAYKLDELVTMANHLNILVSVKRKKDIYDSITTYFKEIKLI